MVTPQPGTPMSAPIAVAPLVVQVLPVVAPVVAPIATVAGATIGIRKPVADLRSISDSRPRALAQSDIWDTSTYVPARRERRRWVSPSCASAESTTPWAATDPSAPWTATNSATAETSSPSHSAAETPAATRKSARPTAETSTPATKSAASTATAAASEDTWVGQRRSQNCNDDDGAAGGSLLHGEVLTC
jgi:hypothetical protein